MALQSLVLMIEDEPAMRRTLRLALQDEGYATLEAATAEDGLFQASLRSPNLVLLDLGLPDRDGIDVARLLRRNHQIPIIVISARDGEDQQIQALDAGANDYVQKPFRQGELLARVRAALRFSRYITVPSETFHNGRLRIEFSRQEVFLDGHKVSLTPKQYKLLALLAREPGRVLTHQVLLREVWGASHVDQIQYLRVYMKQLREKLETDPTRPTMLATVVRVGYRFNPGD
jgi:two-component system, OmpR family, KDP operon response regulator KdpE